jgi:hypothetical protein
MLEHAGTSKNARREKDNESMDARNAWGAAVPVGAVVSSSAVVIDVDHNGLGSVLLYPYYTVNNGQDTLFTSVNPRGAGAPNAVFPGGTISDHPDVNLFGQPAIYAGTFRNHTKVLGSCPISGCL